MDKAEKERRRAYRELRSRAFKHNVERYGLVKAKLIAATITTKQKDKYVLTDKAWERSADYRCGVKLGFSDDE